jgi:hypothetical protein
VFKVLVFILLFIIAIFFFSLVFVYRLLLKPFNASKHDGKKKKMKNVNSIEEKDV